LKHIFINIAVGGLDPIFFDSYTDKSHLFEQINTIRVINHDIAVELMKLKCFKAIFYQTSERHRGIAFSPVRFVGNKYSYAGSFVK
jgi:hypothetical protein